MGFFAKPQGQMPLVVRIRGAIRRWLLSLLLGQTPRLLQSGQLDPQYLIAAEALADEGTLLLTNEIRRLQAALDSQLQSRAEDTKRINALIQETRTLRLVSGGFR